MQFGPKKNVIVPIDFSDRSFSALTTAALFVTQPSDLHVIYVVTPFHAGDPSMVWDPTSDASRQQAASASIHERLAPLNLGHAHVHVAVGSPAGEIVELAEKLGSELIVISTHGRSQSARLLIGSVAEKVVRHAPCDVLVVRGKKAAPATP